MRQLHRNNNLHAVGMISYQRLAIIVIVISVIIIDSLNIQK